MTILPDYVRTKEKPLNHIMHTFIIIYYVHTIFFNGWWFIAGLWWRITSEHIWPNKDLIFFCLTHFLFKLPVSRSSKCIIYFVYIRFIYDSMLCNKMAKFIRISCYIWIPLSRSRRCDNNTNILYVLDFIHGNIWVVCNFNPIVFLPQFSR